jgi:hypothetical protein
LFKDIPYRLIEKIGKKIIGYPKDLPRPKRYIHLVKGRKWLPLQMTS